MQTLAFFIGLVSSTGYFVVWINTITEALCNKDKETLMPNASIIILFAALFSWTWLFYLTH